MTPPRRMYQVGIEGELFYEHAEEPLCAIHGCVPVAPCHALQQRLLTAIDALYALNDADVEVIADTLAELHVEWEKERP